jgi:BirA family biotin operon repressor/biotin-[acetyl-CoA-carboxylase] ligase
MKRIDFDTIDSTNEEAKRRVRAIETATDGDIFGTVITARAQTAGKGRRGRDFHSPGTGDSVYASFILRPPAGPEALQLLTIAAAVAVCRTMEEVAVDGYALTERFTARPAIKWVNDILLDGKKVCGILAEGVLATAPGECTATPHHAPELAAVVLGIGVNITVPIEDFPPELRETAGSLWLPAGEREGFVQLLCKQVLEACAKAGTGDGDGAATRDGDGGGTATEADELLRAYRAYESTTGRQILVRKHAETKAVPAYAKAIADDGGLVVVYADGSEETLRSGEVSILPQT